MAYICLNGFANPPYKSINLSEAFPYQHSLLDTETTTPPPMMKNSTHSGTLFSNFSASSRAVIGSCLSAIRCLETKAEVECRDLEEVCYGQGPAPSEVPSLVSRVGLECRIENILCHVEGPASICDDKLDLCRSAESQVSNEDDSEINTTTLGECYNTKSLLMTSIVNCDVICLNAMIPEL